MKNLLTVLIFFFGMSNSQAQEITHLRVKGIQGEVTFVNNGVDFDKVFVPWKPNWSNYSHASNWDYPFEVSGYQLGSYKYDKDRDIYTVYGDYYVRLTVEPGTFTGRRGNLLFIEPGTDKVVGRVVFKVTNGTFFYAPNRKHRSIQVELLKAIKASASQ